MTADGPRDGMTAKPPVRGAALSLVAGGACLAALALGSVDALAVGALALAVLAGGLYAAARRAVTVAGAGFLLAILLAGSRGAAPEPLLLATLGAVLAWDLGEFAVDVGEQLGREADTDRLLLVHAAVSLLVGVAGAGTAYGVSLAVGGGQPTSAVVFLLVGVVVLVAALRR
ncbi:DUF7519 family protein [Halobellus rubicundus]|uniref:Uncharacterized protein n=1 Tax=Halobellus rubicundus TaxID=2996466 RepID=A0ABD5MAK1_9EURY